MSKLQRCFFVTKIFASSITSVFLFSACGSSSQYQTPLGLNGDGTETSPKDREGQRTIVTQVDVTNTTAASADAAAGPAKPRPNFIAFNAYAIWATGKGDEIFEYPTWYKDGNKTGLQKDDIFVVNRNDYSSGKPTSGAAVNSNILTYPAKDGRELKIRFSAVSDKAMSQYSAIDHCANLEMRLPTARELLDYCAAGVDFNPGSYPVAARCGNMRLWTASVDHELAWAGLFFEPTQTKVFGDQSRDSPYNAICVK